MKEEGYEKKHNKVTHVPPHHAEAVHATSGSEMEIEQRVLMKGNVMAARNSLFDVF